MALLTIWPEWINACHRIMTSLLGLHIQDDLTAWLRYNVYKEPSDQVWNIKPFHTDADDWTPLLKRFVFVFNQFWNWNIPRYIIQHEKILKMSTNFHNNQQLFSGPFDQVWNVMQMPTEGNSCHVFKLFHITFKIHILWIATFRFAIKTAFK